jgi:NAD(P)-dependent dehydrogenase (short-subunit alcohol dehydrogenase family)
MSACIINVSSLLAIKGGMGASVYAASKAGLLAFTRALALEASELRNRIMEDGPALRVNAIVPGFIDTAMIDGKLFLINLC